MNDNFRRGGSDFHATTVADLIEEARKSLTIFLDECQEFGLASHKNYLGKFNVRLDPKDHAAVSLAAAAAGQSLDEWLAGTIRQAIAA